MPQFIFPVEAVHGLAVMHSTELFPVRRVYCVGRNYVEHIREMKEGDERDPPFFFQKPADSVRPDGSVLPYPLLTGDYQHEIELVVALHRGGTHVAVEQALELVFGYAVGLDMTRRDRQRDARDMRLPWEIGKAFDASAPCGALHRVTDVGHLLDGEISLDVNGTRRQTGDLRQMIWNVAEIIANLSTQYALKPGDLIFTGTPAGVGPVVPGDRLEGKIAGLGSIHFTIGERNP
jgi:fumarylpyruvate hydrolase